MSDGAHGWPEPPWWQWRGWDVNLTSPRTCRRAFKARLERSTARWATAPREPLAAVHALAEASEAKTTLSACEDLSGDGVRMRQTFGVARRSSQSLENPLAATGMSPAPHPSASAQARALYGSAHGTSPALKASGRLDKRLDLKPQFERAACAT